MNGDGELDLQEWLELAAIMFLGKGGRELINETFIVRLRCAAGDGARDARGGTAACGVQTLAPVVTACSSIARRRSKCKGSSVAIARLASLGRKRLSLCPAELLIASQLLDDGKKGFITPEDLSTYCAKYAMAPDVTFEEMIAACKPDTDGRLTKAEFGKLFAAMFPDVGKKSRGKKGPGRR